MPTVCGSCGTMSWPCGTVSCQWGNAWASAPGLSPLTEQPQSCCSLALLWANENANRSLLQRWTLIKTSCFLGWVPGSQVHGTMSRGWPYMVLLLNTKKLLCKNSWGMPTFCFLLCLRAFCSVTVVGICWIRTANLQKNPELLCKYFLNKICGGLSWRSLWLSVRGEAERVEIA